MRRPFRRDSAVEDSGELVPTTRIARRQKRVKGQPSFNSIALIPRDLRTSDPSFWTEIQAGYLSLAGRSVDLRDRSIFAVDTPTLHFEQALHEFSWLNDLRTYDPADVAESVQAWFDDWHRRAGTPEKMPAAWTTDVAARRVMSWISHSNILLHEMAPDTYVRLLDQIEHHALMLGAAPSPARSSVQEPKTVLLSAIALVMLDLCMDQPSDRADKNLVRLDSALKQNFGADGVPLSRDLSENVTCLIDLLPLRQCFLANKADIPEWYANSIRSQLSALRALRHRNGDVARFNGVGVLAPDQLAAISSYDVWAEPDKHVSELGDYTRMEAEDVLVLVDTGAPAKDEELSSRAHAGCLSFELSVGKNPFVCNSGRPLTADIEQVLLFRGTAAHSTLVLGQQSSAELVNPTEALRDGIEPSLRGPANVQRNLRQGINADELAASHDGYAARFGRLHNRAMKLVVEGNRLEGQDRLLTVQGSSAQAHSGVEFAVHFHLHPTVSVSRSAHDDVVVCRLNDGTRWQFKSAGNIISLENTSVHLSEHSATPSTQLIVRKTLAESDTLDWSFERVEVG